MSAHSDNRADMPRYDVSLSSQADDAIARLRGHLRANDAYEHSLARMEGQITEYERRFQMTTYTFMKRWRADEIEDTADFNKWRIVASALGYDSAPEYVALRPIPQTVSLTTTPPTEHALAANVGANSSDLESLTDRGDVGADGNAVNVAADTDLETVDDDAGKSDVVNVANEPVSVLPEAGGRGDGKADYPRFHPMKGFSKIQRRIWHWLDEHAAEVNHKYPTQRDVAEAVGTTHPTAGKYLQQWRNHNGITKPEFYQDQAS
jgi:hypothetical protein